MQHKVRTEYVQVRGLDHAGAVIEIAEILDL